MKFTQYTDTYTLIGLKSSSLEIIISHWMEKLLKKCHHGVIYQLNAIQVHDQSSPAIHPDLQLVLDKHHRVFEIPIDLPPPGVSMITTSLSSQVVIPLMYIPIFIHLIKKMK
jgi:hypothetical protein